MKLYATVSSERATKGQGGNTQIVINLRVGSKSRREIANIVLKAEGDRFTLEYFEVEGTTRPMKKRRILLDSGLLETKGKKQKGDNTGKHYCTNCGYVEAQEGKNCTNCGVKMSYRI